MQASTKERTPVNTHKPIQEQCWYKFRFLICKCRFSKKCLKLIDLLYELLLKRRQKQLYIYITDIIKQFEIEDCATGNRDPIFTF